MDDNSAKMRTNMERVLRAMDVIPPLGSVGKQGGASNAMPPRAGAGASSDSARDRGVIPQFNLGEKILAEQRRLTATRRKAPGVSEPVESVPAEVARAPVKASVVGPVGGELLELRQIVADIVARDIERLCTGPVNTSRYR